jgi:hypothetical protein
VLFMPLEHGLCLSFKNSFTTPHSFKARVTGLFALYGTSIS